VHRVIKGTQKRNRFMILWALHILMFDVERDRLPLIFPRLA